MQSKNGTIKLTNSTHLNNLLASRELDSSNIIIDWEKENKKYTSLEVKNSLLEKWRLRKVVSVSVPEILISEKQHSIRSSYKAKNFNFYADLYINNMKQAGNRNYSSEKSKVRQV